MKTPNGLYHGPKAGLVWANVLLAGLCLLPILVEAALWALYESGGFPLGQLAAFPAVFGALLLEAIGENWYIACVPFAVAAVLLRSLFRASEIPLRIRKGTAVLLLSALIIMLIHVCVLYVETQRGRFRGLFA